MHAKLKAFVGSLVLALLLLGGAWTLLGAGDGGPPAVLAATQATGGPDDFGYVYTDSQTTPALYNWVDIVASGTLVGFNDPDTAVKGLNLPDTFAFYGNAYNRLYVTTNGYASFPTVYASTVVTQCHPTERQPPDSVAALCTDLVGDTVYYSTTTAYNGHETFIIQYDGVTHTVSGLTTTFQIILDFEDDAIIYQYHTLPATPGVTATVGIVGYAANAEDYLTYCQSDAGCPPQDALAVRFSLSPPPLLDVTLTPNDYFPDVGETITYTLVLSNSGALASGAMLTNALPAGLDYVSGTLQATDGAPTYHEAERTIHWQGDLAPRAPVTLTYATTLDTGNVIYNSARLAHPLARRDATAVSSPAEPWDDPGPLDAPHKFDHRLGTWRHIAVDDAGTVHVAYAGADLYYATLSGTTWLSETVPGTAPNLLHAALTLDDQNRALIAFYGQERLWLARQTDADWTVEEIAEIGWIGDNFALDLARDSDGHPHLVYNGRGYTTDELHYTAYDGADWLTPTVAIPTPDCYAYNAGFSLALDADDVPHVACTYRGSPPREVRVYTYTAAAPWTGYTTVVSGSDLYYYPSLAFDGATPHLAFYQGSRALYHAAHDGAGWQATLVDDSAPTTYLRQGAALDIGGGQVGILGALRAGSSGNYTQTVYYAARSLTETTWVTGTALTLTYSRNDPRPTLALDGAGQAHLAYYDSRDQTLRYAAEAEGFAPTMADESRSLRAAAVALGVDGAIHVAWDSKGLRYAVGAADTLTWTRQMAVSEPEVSAPALALAVDGADTPHLLYGERDTPLYHATPATDSTWITRVVDWPGDATGFDIAAEVTDTAHVAYIAAQGGNHVLRHAAFDGDGWLTETLAAVSPATWNHDQTPQIVAQGGQVYVLYADCTQNPDNGSDYPIALQLATWNGSAWAHNTLYDFVGQCDWQLTYQLAGDADGRLSAVAHINSDAVRPRPLVVTFWIADAAGQQQVTQQTFAATGATNAAAIAQPSGVQAPTMMSYIIQAMLRGDGGLATWIEYGARIIQQWDREGNLSGKIPEETGSRSVAIEDGAGDGERSVVIERWEHENELRVPRAKRKPPCDECCLDTQVQPAAAAADGCTAAPAHIEGECGSEVEVTAQEVGSKGWNFKQWSGAASGGEKTTMATMSGATPNCSVAVAEFVQPVLTLSGSADEPLLCPSDAVTDEVTIIEVTLTANDEADWIMSSITFHGSGSGDEKEDIDTVKLYKGAQLLGETAYASDDGSVSFADLGIEIPAGSSVTLRLAYVFDNEGMQCSQEVKEFVATTKMEWVTAIPFSPNYEYYVKIPSGPFSGAATLACVHNVNTDEGFALIQSAIDDADTQYGHTLKVCPGDYKEEVDVNKELTIYSTGGRDVTTVDGGFTLEAPEVTIKGFTITGSGTGVIAGSSAYQSTIADNTIRENSSDGVYLTGGFESRIYGNLITHNDGHGIAIWEGHRHVIGGATAAERNIISANGENGINMYSTEKNRIQGNYIGAGPDGQTALSNTRHGIALEDSDANLIGGEGQGEGNLISGNWGDGVDINGKNNRVLGNIIGGAVDGGALPNRWSGVWISLGAPGNEVHGNYIDGNLRYGVKSSGNDTRITSNEILRNNEGGISLPSSHGSTIRDNLISANDGPGIDVSQTTRVNIFNNRIGIDAEGTFDPNVGHGIHLLETGKARIAANIIRFNRGAGIYLDGAFESDIWENRIGANAQHGVEVRSSRHINVTHNAISEHPESGIYAWQSHLEYITRNQIHDNCRGIHLVKSAVSVAHGNTIRSNTCNTGIHLDDSTADIAGNLIANDAHAAILCENGASPTIRQNHITANQGGGVLSESGAVPTIWDNNITGNSDYGARNADPAVTLDARENWWGAANGPGGVGPGVGDAVSEYVDYGDWRTEPMSVVVIAEHTLVQIVVGSEGSNNIALNHFGILSDTLTVVVTDTLGWLSGPTHFTVPLEADLGAGYAISITVPAGTSYGTISQVYVTAVSQHDSTAQDEDTFRVKAAPPCNPPADVKITGVPTATLAIPATFTATVEPLTNTIILPMTFPLTYTWEASGLPSQIHVISEILDTATFTWTRAGAQTVTVTVQGPCGDVVSDTHVLNVETAPVENHPPVADAGPSQTVAPGDEVTLDGSASSDPNGDPLTYHWQQTGGPAVSFTSTLSRTTFTAPDAAGVLTFTLTVTDTGGLKDSAMTLVTVQHYHVYLPLVLRTTP